MCLRETFGCPSSVSHALAHGLHTPKKENRESESQSVKGTLEQGGHPRLKKVTAALGKREWLNEEPFCFLFFSFYISWSPTESKCPVKHIKPKKEKCLLLHVEVKTVNLMHWGKGRRELKVHWRRLLSFMKRQNQTEGTNPDHPTKDHNHATPEKKILTQISGETLEGNCERRGTHIQLDLLAH